MKLIQSLFAFCLLLTTLCSCQEESMVQPQPSQQTNLSIANVTPAAQGGIIITNGPALPSLTIVEQVYVPTNEFFADTRCRAWRITWPTYPAGTNPDLIPTMFSVPNRNLYSFNYLNTTAAANTYKASFNLYHGNKIASVYAMWSELTHAVDGASNLEQARFNKSKFPLSTIESWVKGRPDQFKLRWEDTIDTVTEIENYQKGDIYQYRLVNQNRYGGIRIVSMSPRIIEVYSAEPNQ